MLNHKVRSPRCTRDLWIKASVGRHGVEKPLCCEVPLLSRGRRSGLSCSGENGSGRGGGGEGGEDGGRGGGGGEGGGGEGGVEGWGSVGRGLRGGE